MDWQRVDLARGGPVDQDGRSGHASDRRVRLQAGWSRGGRSRRRTVTITSHVVRRGGSSLRSSRRGPRVLERAVRALPALTLSKGRTRSRFGERSETRRNGWIGAPCRTRTCDLLVRSCGGLVDTNFHPVVLSVFSARNLAVCAAHGMAVSYRVVPQGAQNGAHFHR